MRDSKYGSIISGSSKTGEQRYLGKVSLTVIVMTLLILICMGMLYYFHWIRGSEIVFTHFFYLPIVLAGFLWKRQGAWIGVFLGALLLVSHFLSGLGTPLKEDFLRFAMFAVVGLTVGVLREQALRSEEKLSETKEMLENIAQGITDGVLLLSKDFKIIWANNTILKEAGCKIEEVIANLCYKITHHRDEPCQPPQDICPIHEVLETGKPVTVNHTHFNKDGSEFYVEVSAYPVRDEKGEISQFVHIARDVTERVKAERVLAEAKDYTDNIVKSMIDTMIVVDPEAQIKTINKATTDLLGYTENELIDKPVATIFAEEEEEEEEEEVTPFKGTRMKKLIEEGSIRDYDMTYKTKTGEKIPVSFSGSVMRDKNGELVGIVGIARDMREVKRLMEKEKELAAAAAAAAAEKKRADELEKAQDASLNIMEDLERRRKELDDAIKELRETQAKLIQAGKMAAMGTLGAGIAHQLNQPLAGIRGFTQTVLMQIDKKNPFYEDLKKIEEQTGYMRDIILNVSGFARTAEFKKEPIDINEPIEKALQLFSEQIRLHGIKLVKNLDPKLPKVNADINQMQQVFVNFITNARDALDDLPKEERKELAITTKRTENRVQSTESVEIIFSDTGPGIPAEIKDKIFDPFFTTKGPRSTGLGLSLNFGMIQDHGGVIEVESEKGKGATFIVRLPVVGK